LRKLKVENLEDRSVPATFTVNTVLDEVTSGDGKLSLREAITKANALAGPDTIVLSSGVYKIALTGTGEDANATGDFDITDSLTIAGAGAGLTIIDGRQLDRVFDVLGIAPSSTKAVFAGLTIRNGRIASTEGGGIRVGNADLAVRDCVLTGNQSNNGGAVSTNRTTPATGQVKIVRTRLIHNTAGARGGGIYLEQGALTVNACIVSGNVVGDDGGGIFSSADTVTVTGSTISGNFAISSEGGGICMFTGALTVTSSTISGNVSTGMGGGIRADETVTLTNCTVSGNSALVSGGGINAGTATLTGCTVSGNVAAGTVPGTTGGGINATTVTLSRSTVSGNTSVNGGGINAMDVTLTRSTVSGNTVSGSGGGITAGTATLTASSVSGNTAGLDAGGINGTTANLSRCTVSGNIAAHGDGGGINVITANLTNCTVAGNFAALGGGGVWADGADLLNCTITGNFAHSGGGLSHNFGGEFHLRNTLVALNLVDVGNAGADVSGDFISDGHNLIGVFVDPIDGSGFTNGVNGDIVGTAANPVDPKLGPLANNGRPTKTCALKASSAAIDAGDPSVMLSTDQRGLPRVKDGNFDGSAIVDIGAFER